ncbi:hypothetical protein JXI42_00675 [bacterium]|nr:hypothetical protein [bacterium]
MMKFIEKLMSIDRRIIYILIALAIIIPFFVPMGLPIPITKEVESIYNYIEDLGPNDAIIISNDYDPQTKPELYPMVKAIIRHAFDREVKVIVMTLIVTGVGLAEEAVKEVADEYGMVNGKDYCFLGYRPGWGLLILGMGVDIHTQFPTDYYGTPIKDIPVMADIHNFDDIDLVLSFSGSSIVVSWLTMAKERFGQNIAWGVTGVMAPDYYIYLQSGQIVGMLGGLKGAAEYETLINKPDTATAGMDAQSWAHVIIIVFILIGNIGFFITGKKNLKPNI